MIRPGIVEPAKEFSQTVAVTVARRGWPVPHSTILACLLALLAEHCRTSNPAITVEDLGQSKGSVGTEGRQS